MGKITMPAARTTPLTTMSLAAMTLAVSRQVMKSAAQEKKRHDMDYTFVVIDGGSSPSARSSAVASAASWSWLAAKMRHWATLPGRYLSSSVSGSAVTSSRLASETENWRTLTFN